MRISRLAPYAIAYCSALLLLTVLIYACKKDGSINDPSNTGIIPDLTTKISASVSGFVTDESDAPVIGAAVQMGDGNAITDQFGYFEIKNTQVVRTAAQVTVLKNGYFKGIKTFIATGGESAFFRIKLLPKNNAGSFDAGAGGTVSLPDGLSLRFPAGAVVQAGTGTAYSGTVRVAAQWINPVGTDLHRVMPGDLRGIDSSGFMRQLTSYGMAAVELTGPGGELLQVAPGKKATLTFPIPPSISGRAPASIPLWSFDEAKGLWKQEGMANKSGSSYVGEVSHFSFWNCDVPDDFVQFSCIIQDMSGNPLQNVLVKISVVDNPVNAAWGYTNQSGYTGGAIPKNAQLLLEVFPQNGCGGPILTQNITTTSQDLNLGTLSVQALGMAAVSGTVTNCAGAPVTNGFVIMLRDNQRYRYPVSSTGSFSFSTPLCNNTPVTVQLVAQDADSLQAGSPQTLTLSAGTNAAGNLSACGTAIDAEFIEYSVNGVNYRLSTPADELLHDLAGQAIPPLMYISASSVSSPVSDMRYAILTFRSNGIAAGSTHELESFQCREILDSTSIRNTISLRITEYGSIGQFIAGNFTGTFSGAPPANLTYNVVCRFRVKRQL